MLIGGLLAEDLGIMVEGSDGQYYLGAGAICIPGWSKVGRFILTNFNMMLNAQDSGDSKIK